jgi:ABC-type branched-subunit amino acid transport system substrate-binding protein
VRDGAWDPESALTAVRQLTDQRQTLAIIGGPGGHVAAVLGDQLQQRDVLFFSLAGVSLSAGYGAGGHDQAEADALLDRWGIANAQLTTVIQGTINGRAVDAHGASVQAAFANGSAPGLELIAPVYTLDFDALVRQWLPWAAQQAAEGERTLGVVLGVDAPTAVGFVRTARAALGAVGASAADARRWGLSADDAAALAGIEVRFATLSSTGPTAWSAGLDVPGMPKDCIGLWAAQTHPPVAQGGELVDAFRADLEALDAAAYPSESALRGYLLGRALIEALDAQGAEISAETFKQTLAGLNAFDFLAGEGISAEDRQLFETVYLIETDADCAWQAVP